MRHATLILVLVLTAMARAETYAPTTQPGFPQQLFHDAVHSLRSAAHVTLEVDIRTTSWAKEKVDPSKNESTVNFANDEVVKAQITWPNKIRISNDFPVVRNGWRLLQTLIFNGKDVILIREGTNHVDPRASRSPYDGHTVNQVLREGESLLLGQYPELVQLLDGSTPDLEGDRLKDWQWLGAASDNGELVWQVIFTTADNIRWQACITQSSPHTLVRLVTTREDTKWISEVSLDEFGQEDDGKRVDHRYKAEVRRELNFRKYDLETPIPPETFAPPADVKLRDGHFARHETNTKAGAIIELSPMKTLDGGEINPAKLGGPVLLDFWFVNCPICIASMPDMQKLAKEANVPLIAVNPIDPPDYIRRLMDKRGWKDLTVALDTGRTYAKRLDIIGYPTVVAVNPNGKVLFIGHLSTDTEVDLLKDILKDNAKPSP